MFTFTILRRGVGTRHMKMDAMGKEEHVDVVVVELMTIVALKSLDGGLQTI